MNNRTRKTIRRSGPAARSTSRDRKPDASRRRLLVRGGIAFAAAVPAALLLHRHDVQARELHDLGAIGEGKPVVVQVHDPSCPMCRRLKANTAAALADFPDIRYRIADLTEREGRAFGKQHDVGKVTLLLFDERGRRVGTVQGVTSAAALRERFARQLGAAAS